MTADRWWVQAGARWLARIDGIKGQIQMLSLGVTAFSTFSLLLQGFGLGEYVAPLGVLTLFTVPIYAFYYNEGGVRNQVRRDTQDLATNFSGPVMAMDDTLIGVSVFTAVNGRPPTQEEIETIEAAVHGKWETYRDGIEIDG